MTEKRFDSVYYEDFCRVITDNGKEINPLQVVDLLNELHEENMMLKEYNNKLMKQPLLFDVQTIPNTMRIMEANTQLEEENEQLKQFKEKVFSLFDKEIARNEEAIEWGKEIGAGIGSIGFYNHMLNRLKKELQE